MWFFIKLKLVKTIERHHHGTAVVQNFIFRQTFLKDPNSYIIFVSSIWPRAGAKSSSNI